MAFYRLTQGKHYRMVDGQQVKLTAGAIFEPTTAELKAFGDRLELVAPSVSEAQVPADSAEPASPSEDSAPALPEPEPEKPQQAPKKSKGKAVKPAQEP